MSKFSSFILALALSGLSSAALAVQTCHDQSQIPATTPTARFTDHGDGTLTDTQTELMWAKCAEGLSGDECTTGSVNTYSWLSALGRASTSELASYGDWRLPNVKELFSIVEEQCYDPAINLSVFPNTPTLLFYWASSPYADFASYAWYVNFSLGFSQHSKARGTALFVRLVRGGT